jgi:CheY-like chemotaxis protein
MASAAMGPTTHDMFLVAQRASTRLAPLRDAMEQLFAHIGATRLRSVDLYYRSQTDVALLALHLERARLSPAALAALEGAAMRAELAVLEPARLPEAERARFYQSYLGQYELRLERLGAPDDALVRLEEHLASVSKRRALARRGAELEVRFRRGDSWQLGRVRSLSRDTIYVSTGGPPRRGDVVEIALALGPASLHVRGGVLQVTPADSPHAQGAPGFGAQFLVADVNEADRVERFLAYLRQHLPSDIQPPPKRRDVRYPVRWPVVVSTAGGPTGTMALDISRHGLFLAAHASAEASPDTRIELTVPVDDGGTPVRVGTRVARTVTPDLARERGVPTGFGLEIVSVAPREEVRFGRFLLRVGRRTTHTVLVGAAPERAAAIVAELTAAGYAASQVADAQGVVARAAAARAPDLVLIDATLTRADARAEDSIRRALAQRQIPLLHVHSDSPQGARAAADMTLLS